MYCQTVEENTRKKFGTRVTTVSKYRNKNIYLGPTCSLSIYLPLHLNCFVREKKVVVCTM